MATLREDMADTKEGRDKQARDEENRQRQRELEENLARGDEPEPAAEGDDAAELDAALASHDFPASSQDLIQAYGEYEVHVRDDAPRLREVLRDESSVTFESPQAVRDRIDDLLT